MRAAAGAVAVTGIGMVTAAGHTAKQTWVEVTSATAPSSVRRPDTLRDLPCDFMYTVEGLDLDARLGPTARLTSRFAQLAVIAAREAVADAGLDPNTWDSARVAVVVGTAHGGLDYYDEQQAVLTARGARRVAPKVAPLSVNSNAASSVCQDLGARGPSLAVSTACASGTDAIGTALGWLRAGRCDIAVAGGAESLSSRLVYASTCQMRALSTRVDDPAAACRPFDVDRDGFVTGEGAGLLVLENAEHARARGATVRARLAGYGSSNDAFSPVAPDERGAGVEAALRTALADAGLAPGDVGHVNAHGTSTVINDLVESAALYRVFGDRPLVTSTKAMTGHTLGAAGGIEAALTALALEEQLVPPTVNLEVQDPGVPMEVVAGTARPARLECAASSSLGFGGHNAVLVLTRA
ncbi:beta-ketoacyl-[acyl-carrier-protein] synthase family protein [Streptomyces candidus]|uniref:3-oxoacyl-[acyl-carrier-protein] synthase II n=1 Tax=Streptomyces candidus TaxID=67283 RepID=A0A7X0LRY4_9ACTN|nr:beta-ketoacyl-[acyl-carrier-protein] synthase family protein [Streptomyces candidus]MBB6438597.1 3-oxoacyl-[acyl-carrier-protein] synthase II [Streptomyces candidus]GHH45374.1 3-oxoacyl-ACP synthase [Streptomyces candidus]